MRRMARHTTLGFDHWMLIGEWPRVLRVALGADSVPISSGLQIFVLERPVRVMAVAALDQALIYSVMERLRKCRLDVRMAGVAKPWLGDFE